MQAKPQMKGLNMNAKTIYSGTTHNVGGANGYTRSADGLLDLRLDAPHPAAENFFGAAWSACFIGAIGLAAAQKKVALPQSPAVDATIDLLMEGGAFFLRATLDVTVPGIDIDLARELVHVAHEICPYSKATRGNIDVQVNVLEPAFA
jgi:Ohr subfamily peroxiredoxin